ncbi:MAG: hypothetical protein H6581_01415 [Bacteroidia bacterium]|nr:hypothetical protein [Bacteroidia bacterium]
MKRTLTTFFSCIAIIFGLTACKKCSNHSNRDHFQGPQTIVLIRHAEKPACATNDSCSKYYDVNVCPDLCDSKKKSPVDTTHCACKESLAPCGKIRAESLAIWIPCWYPKLKQIFATAIDHGKCPKSGGSKSCRPQQTVDPLVAKLRDVPYDTTIAKDCICKLAQTVLSGEFRGDTILICWQHEEIPTIAYYLGADTTNFSKWPPCNFDWIWELNYSGENSSNYYSIQKYIQPPISCDTYRGSGNQKNCRK